MGKIQVKRCSPAHPLEVGEIGWCKEKEVLLVGRGNGTNKEIGEESPAGQQVEALTNTDIENILGGFV